MMNKRKSLQRYNSKGLHYIHEVVCRSPAKVRHISLIPIAYFHGYSQLNLKVFSSQKMNFNFFKFYAN